MEDVAAEFKRKTKILNETFEKLSMEHLADQVEKYLWTCICSPNIKRSASAMHRHMLIEGIKGGIS